MTTKKKNTNEEGADKWAYLLKPAKDLTDNFSIDLLSYLNEYLDVIRHRNEEEDQEQSFDVESNYKLFNFAQACLVIQGSTMVYAKKVDFIFEEVYGVWGLVENAKEGENGPGGASKKGRKRKIDIGSTANFELLDMKAVKTEILKNATKFEKEEKIAVDNLRLVDNAEFAEMCYERKNVRAVRPTQFMFGRNSCQFMRTDEQFYNAKTRPEVVGKVRDFDVKKSEILHDHEMLILHDSYRRNVDQFNLPGAKWIPDNKELAANFGVAEIEAELDLEQRDNRRITAHGPFKDPLSGREIVAPPKWYIEQEVVKQQETIARSASAATNYATIRDSQGGSQKFGGGSQVTRMSQPFFEKQRNSLNQFVSFVEGRLNKNRASTHLNTHLVDMFVENYGGEKENHQPFEPMDYDDGDYGGGEGGMDENEEEEDDYIDGLRKNRERRQIAPWDETENDLMRGLVYGENEDVRKNHREVRIIQKEPTTSLSILAKKTRKNEKMGENRRDKFMRTQDYLQNHYYWRSSARLNPTNDWKIDALRTHILKEQKRRARERTAKIRGARSMRVGRSQNRNIGQAQFEQAFDGLLDGENEIGGEGIGEENREKGNRRTLGAEYDDIADEDLAAEVEISMLGGAYDDDFDDIAPFGETVPPIPGGSQDPTIPSHPQIETIHEPQQLHQGLTFNAIDDAELANIFNLPGDLFVSRALPLLKKFAENRTDREQMAYEMAKAYENVDVATSRLQQQVDEWQEKLEPILDEGETRKEYKVHEYGGYVLDQFGDEPGETKTLAELCAGKCWFEISRYFLSCLLMSNTKKSYGNRRQNK
ncbi:unnamed protein product [Caenorhabditis angaria]|uniref:Condensin-2 complex subunit H2 C-terminal domain-containing protein n=1 Tax=Caenorhabditis angaria TaxID=860376 RepID=A0A9P1IH68_9PELO|nr:unnamed protein product [Caenorhabditis angaria]